MDGVRRIYRLDAAPLQGVDAWLAQFRSFWTHRLDALATEVARGKRRSSRAGAGNKKRRSGKKK